MIKPISSFSSFIYVRITKPILFLFPADNVHDFIARAGIITQNIPILPSVLKKIWRYDNPRLEQNILNIKFKNPIGLSAGFDKEVRLPKLMNTIGFGIEEVGSITAEEYKGNKKPWYSRLKHTKSILVNSGLKSSGVEAITKRAEKISKSTYQSIVINASVARTNFQDDHTLQQSIDDYCTSLTKLEQSKWPKMYTINISCPNTKGGEPFNNPENLKKLLKSIDNLKLTRPVFLKLPIDLGWAKTEPLIKVAVKSSLQGLTIGNLSKDRTLVSDKDNLSPNQKGNLSGKPCWQASNELLARTYKSYGDRFVLIGVGGVFSSKDAYTKIKLGATFVELITGLIFNGPSLIGSINHDIIEYLNNNNLENISEAIGIDVDDYIKTLDKIGEKNA
jgi:dihydroorotate dehydrogenase (fumarate)